MAARSHSGSKSLLIDSHAHLTDERFDGELPSVLARAREAGVVRVITIAVDAGDSEAAAALAAAHPDQLQATTGIHPHAAAGATPEARARVEALAAHAAAIGETGLDYHYDNAPRAIQRKVFEWQLDLGRRVNRPVVVHARDADDDVGDAIRAAGSGTRGVLHCFSSGRGLLETALTAGWYISFSGMITFRNYGAAELLRSVPADRLLVETDSPYLAPVPHRGRRNEPAHVALVARRAAELRGEDAETLAAATTMNAMRFYGLA